MGMLENNVAIITGASSGIGREIARLFASEGAAVVATARREQELAELVDEISRQGGKAAFVAGDVADETLHKQLIETAIGEFGGVDIAVNNAGTVGPFKPLAEVDLQEWQELLSVNLTGAFLGAKHQIPAMLQRSGGALVFTSSFVGNSAGLPGMSAYGASKAGLMGLVRGITADYAADGIRANALMPGGTDTDAAGDDAQKEWAAGLHAMKRIADPMEIAKAALFLVSPMASFVAGTALFADGGNSATK